MLIPRSQEVASHIDDIAANARELPETLAFFERMLADNPGITDFTKGKTPDQRKELWNQYISINDAKGKSKTIIEISLYAKKQSDAEALSKKTAQTLFAVMGGYYDIRTELDMRIIDGPISGAAVRGLWWIISLSAIVGFLGAFVVSFATEKLFTFGFSLKSMTIRNQLEGMGNSALSPNVSTPSSIEDLYLPEELAAVKEAKKPTEETRQLPEKTAAVYSEEMQKMQYPDFPEMPLGHDEAVSKGSVAPDNLPVFDGTSLRFGDVQENAAPLPEALGETKIASTEQHSAPIKQHEPTQEEIKQRLNALLSGKL